MTVIHLFRTKTDDRIFARSYQYGNIITGKCFHVGVVAPYLCKDDARDQCLGQEFRSMDETKKFVAGLHKEAIGVEDLVVNRMGS